MIRTYKPRKNTKLGLNSKDAVLSSDDKAFDALYIQNIKIKQAKREISYRRPRKQCGYNSRKIRQRKLVKRIITESNPLEEASQSRSTFLTPDKSIHVNKALDPFDQLFNSTQHKSNESERHAKELRDPFDQLLNSIQHKSETENNYDINKELVAQDSSLQQGDDKENSQITQYPNKVFHKLNSSSPNNDHNDFLPLSKTSETKVQRRRKAYRKVKRNIYRKCDSDSEKENSTDSINATNINTHKLHIEKEDNCITDNDGTINDVMKNTSLMKRIADIQNRNNNPHNTPKFKRNSSSPGPTNSLMSSTPVLKKQRDIRGKSIFKLSPIYIENSEQRSNREIESKKDNSIIFIDHDVPGHVEFKASLIAHHIDNGSNINKLDNSLISHNKSSFEETKNINESIKINDNIKSIHREKISVEVFVENENDLEKYDSSCSSDKTARELSIKNSTEINVENSAEDDTRESSSVLECSLPIKPFLGFYKAELNDETAFKSIQSEHDANSHCSISSNSENSNNESYDTCNSDQSAIVRDLEPKVRINRINKSLFERYYRKMADFESFRNSCDSNESAIVSDRDNETDNIINTTKGQTSLPILDCTSLNKSQNRTISDSNISCASNEDIPVSEKSFNSGSESEVDQSICTSTIYTPKDSFSGESRGKVEEHVSYVTTRRRRGKLYDVNNSYYDIACLVDNDNETVIDNEDTVPTNSTSESEVDLVGFENDSTESSVNDEKSAENQTVVETRSPKSTTNINEDDNTLFTRKSERLTMKSKLDDNQKTRNTTMFSCEPKMGIVLQAGKKWERSLSIYRRMTMRSPHFDLSLLEEEPMLGKGRKYRQSVINTMEMQDYTDLVHNESISNRKSLFVSKSGRPAPKIVKGDRNSRLSLCSTTATEDWKGFLSEDCDDTVVGLSKLSIAEQDCDVTVLEKINEDRVSSARDYVLRRCNQTEALLFDECYPDTLLKNCRKIGEGVYGEVFLYRGRDGLPRVMKIVPIAGSVKVNGEQQKDFHEIISEIVIAMELSALRAPIAEIDQQLNEGKDLDALDIHTIENATDVFNEVLAVKCVYGSYPSRLLDLWDLYDECKGSENDNPAILPRDQQYIALELANAGEDLESYQFNNAEQAHALFYQVAFGLAVGEEAFQFEHRDLHWGNVLIAPTEKKWATFVLRGRVHRVARCGVAATIIDYSLSRLSLPLADDCATLYNDLAHDDGLFDAVGDYQFEVYRLMRDKLGNEWKNFEPYTNILWLHYIVDKMIVALRYKRTNTKVHKHFLAKLKAIRGRILEYQSVSHFLLDDNEF